MEGRGRCHPEELEDQGGCPLRSGADTLDVPHTVPGLMVAIHTAPTQHTNECTSASAVLTGSHDVTLP